jgi:HPt (histidine-containing phosphotransfer) domain-containing protein
MVSDAIDIAHLKQQTFDDPDFQREILEMFQQQAPILLVALAANTGVSRAEIAHRIKGSALAIGANALADRAGQLETAPDDALLMSAVHLSMETTLQAAAEILSS